MDFIRSMLEESVADPLAMCDHLKIGMTAQQREILDRFRNAEGRIDLQDINGDVLRAVLIGAFWRTLRMRDNMAAVLVPERRGRQRVMDFLHRMVSQHSAMHAVVSWPRWWSMQFSRRPSWALVTPSCYPEQLAGFTGENLTVVALADEALPNYIETVKAGEVACARSKGSLFVQLWH